MCTWCVERFDLNLKFENSFWKKKRNPNRFLIATDTSINIYLHGQKIIFTKKKATTSRLRVRTRASSSPKRKRNWAREDVPAAGYVAAVVVVVVVCDRVSLCERCASIQPIQPIHLYIYTSIHTHTHTRRLKFEVFEMYLYNSKISFEKKKDERFRVRRASSSEAKGLARCTQV